MRRRASQGATTLIIAASVSLTSACYYHEVESRNPPVTVATYAPPMMVAQTETTPAAQSPQPVPQVAPPAQTVEQQVVVPAPNAVQTPEPLPELSPEIAEVVKLAQSQVGDDVLLNYIANAQHGFAPTADELIFLADIGVSNDVINALIQKSPDSQQLQAAVNVPQAQAPAPVQGSIPQQQVVVDSGAPNVVVETPHAGASQPEVVQGPPAQVIQQETVVVQQPVAQQTVVYEVAEPVSYFQPVLAPYGTWVDIAPYGLCWQPSVAVIDTSWRPYGNRGRWLHTDVGWYWQSDYSWGWAPFHYGRWHRHTRFGWVWTPGSTWGPAWVSWRRSNAYCGWAPLPPVARYRSGFGFSYLNTSVGVHFDWGLSAFDYCYLPLRRFHTHHPHRHFLPRHSVRSVHNGTRVINDHHRDRSRNLVNRGVPRDEIAKLTRSEIRRVRIADRPAGSRSVVQPDRVVRQGNDLAIYRGGPVRGSGASPRSRTSAAATEPGGRGRSEAVRPSGSASSLSSASRQAIRPTGGGGAPVAKASAAANRPTPAGGGRPLTAPRPISVGASSKASADRSTPGSRSTVTRSAPRPVTSTPTNPRLSVGGLRPSKPVTSRPSTPNAPSGNLTAPRPLASTPKPLAQPSKSLTPPKPITSVPRQLAKPAPVSAARSLGSPSWQPYGSSAAAKPTGSSLSSRKPTPSPSSATSRSKPITGFQNPSSAIYRRNSSSSFSTAPRSSAPSGSSRVVVGKPASPSKSSVGSPSRVYVRPSASRPSPSPSRPSKQYSAPTTTRSTPAPRAVTPRPTPSRPTVSRSTPSRSTISRPTAPRAATPQYRQSSPTRSNAPVRRAKPTPSSRPVPNRR